MFRFLDVSVSQRGIVPSGVDGVIIKASGANDGLYVAGAYADHVARGRAAFGNVGHYFFNGLDAAPAVAANFFVDHLQYQAGDALFLDVENEGAMRAWSPAEAHAFLTVVKQRVGVVPVLYMSASVTRSQDWSACIDLGSRLWVASYGANTGDQGAEPAIGGWAEWSLWQYTSQGRVAGWPSGVDLNVSRIRISEVHMTNDLANVQYYARTHPTRDGGSWSGWCASFVYRAGGFSRSFGNAMAAGDFQAARGRMRTDWQNAPAGAIHYWAGVGGDGHTAFDIGGNVLLMASSSVTSPWGTALGTVSFQTYARKGIPYRGWSMFWGDESLAGSSAGTAGGISAPILEDDMPDMREFLNTPAYDGGPTISTFFKNVDQGGIAAQVWDTKVQRGDVHVASLQELADVKTIVIRLEAQNAAMTAAIGAIAAGTGADPAAIVSAAREGAEAALKNLKFTAATTVTSA